VAPQAPPTERSLPGPLAALGRRLAAYRPGLRIAEQGTVESVGDGICWVRGLPSAAMEELLAFADGSRGVVFHLAGGRLGAVLLSQTDALSSGTGVYRTGQALGVPVGDALLGRVVDPLGEPLDGRPAPACEARRPLECPAPPITERDFVSRPLFTGLKVVDTMIPIGMGQRELIIGDAGLGRSALALDAVIHQRGRDVRCVYVLVGQKRSAVVSTLETLARHGAMEFTTVVVGEASALPGLKHLAPFAGCAVAEHWMHRGCDTLVVYDDLSTHAATYRELSLLLRRPPGREAYPGDIFFLHARLLERATCLAAEQGGGSMTALPIVTTQQGEIAAFIPTNLISITDGQIYLDDRLFASGFRPAVDVGRSVSRIGGKAQPPAIQTEAGRMKLDYLQFLELEAFTLFGARLEAGVREKLRRGRLLRALLKQDRLKPLAPEFHLAWLVAFNDGLLDDVPPEDVPAALEALETRLAEEPLTLDDERRVWAEAVRRWLGVPAGDEGTGEPAPEAAPPEGQAPEPEAPEGEAPEGKPPEGKSAP
jgi:F-type H+-transporting ATPase subunit alpha